MQSKCCARPAQAVLLLLTRRISQLLQGVPKASTKEYEARQQQAAIISQAPAAVQAAWLRRSYKESLSVTDLESAVIAGLPPLPFGMYMIPLPMAACHNQPCLLGRRLAQAWVATIDRIVRVEWTQPACRKACTDNPGLPCRQLPGAFAAGPS